MSLPLWERGLKYTIPGSERMATVVAPLVGAWIEIDKLDKDINGKHVAPLVGAWIEITLPICMTVMIPSLPLWERGLKFPVRFDYGLLALRRSPCGSVD